MAEPNTDKPNMAIKVLVIITILSLVFVCIWFVYIQVVTRCDSDDDCILMQNKHTYCVHEYHYTRTYLEGVKIESQDICVCRGRCVWR